MRIPELASAARRLKQARERFAASWRTGTPLRIEDLLADTNTEERPALFAELLSLSEQLNEVSRNRGWQSATFFVPIAGEANVLVAEYDYPDLATCDAQSKAAMADPEWIPDFPAPFNAKAGATVIGVREFLIAYNVNLNTGDRRLAQDIALTIRETGRAQPRRQP